MHIYVSRSTSRTNTVEGRPRGHPGTTRGWRASYSCLVQHVLTTSNNRRVLVYSQSLPLFTGDTAVSLIRQAMNEMNWQSRPFVIYTPRDTVNGARPHARDRARNRLTERRKDRALNIFYPILGSRKWMVALKLSSFTNTVHHYATYWNGDC